MGYPTGKVIPGRIEELFAKYPNLYGDMSAGSGFNAITRDPEYGCGFLERFKDRLFFATDICEPENRNSPHYRFSFWLDDMYEAKRISADCYEKISYKNALKILEG
jgi:predicted TIM-barrel fold metal-dependent hydrolase